MTLDFIVQKYGLSLDGSLPIEIPNVGRNDLAALFAELGFTRGVELGVEAAAYSEVLCKANPGLTLFGVDPWVGYPGYKEGDRNMEANRLAAQARMLAYDFIPIQKFSEEAVRDFDDESLDFVYIDANHDLLHVIQDITLWLPKIRPDGIIAGHDYCDRILKRNGRRVPNRTHHVIEAVQAYTRAYDIQPWFVLGRKEKREGETRDKNRSWMFVTAPTNLATR